MSGKPKHRDRLCESIGSSEGRRRQRQVTSCQAGAMLLTLTRLFALGATLAALTLGEAATAQGVYVPMPGSAPAATGPNSINPSAPASSVDPNAFNPSAAPSAVMTPNALNPSATPSTFAPLLTEPGGERRVLIGPVAPLYGIVPGSGRRKVARIRRRGPRPAIHRRVDAPIRQAPPRIDRRARAIEDSICRGC